MTFDVATSADPGDGNRNRRRPPLERSIAAEVLKKKIKLTNNIIPPPPLPNSGQLESSSFDIQKGGNDESYDDDDHYTINKPQPSQSSQASYSKARSRTATQINIPFDSEPPPEPFKQRSASEIILEIDTLLADFPQLQPYLKYKFALERKGDGEYSLPHSSTFFENACEACLDHGDVCLFDNKNTSAKCLACTKFGGKCMFRNLEGLRPEKKEIHFVCGRCQRGLSSNVQRNPDPVLSFSTSKYLQNRKVSLVSKLERPNSQFATPSLFSHEQIEIKGSAIRGCIESSNPSIMVERSSWFDTEQERRKARQGKPRAQAQAQADRHPVDEEKSQLNRKSRAGGTPFPDAITRLEQREQVCEGQSIPVVLESRKIPIQPRPPRTTDRRRQLPKIPIQTVSKSSCESISSNASNTLQGPTMDRAMSLLTGGILPPPVGSSRDLSPHYGNYPQGPQGVRTEQNDDFLNLAPELSNCETDCTRQQSNEPRRSSSLSSATLSLRSTGPPASYSHCQRKQHKEDKVSKIKDTKVYQGSVRSLKVDADHLKTNHLDTKRKTVEGTPREDKQVNLPREICEREGMVLKFEDVSGKTDEIQRKGGDEIHKVRGRSRRKRQEMQKEEEIENEKLQSPKEPKPYTTSQYPIFSRPGRKARGRIFQPDDELQEQYLDIETYSDDFPYQPGRNFQRLRTIPGVPALSLLESKTKEQQILEQVRVFAQKIYIKQSEDGLQSLTIDARAREMYEMKDAKRQLKGGFEEAQGGEVIARVVEREDEIEVGREDREIAGSVAEFWERRMKEEHESLDGKFWDYHPRKHR
ncbi:hypothetical protein BGZ60DRAFT_419380 [Tricladium varicosporioides]|nr:hypothetical protein BGZ60DRAFT_419380 [Hymenoscyphus varicosporioides]